MDTPQSLEINKKTLETKKYTFAKLRLWTTFTCKPDPIRWVWAPGAPDAGDHQDYGL